MSLYKISKYELHPIISEVNSLDSRCWNFFVTEISKLVKVTNNMTSNHWRDYIRLHEYSASHLLSYISTIHKFYLGRLHILHLVLFVRQNDWLRSRLNILLSRTLHNTIAPLFLIIIIKSLPCEGKLISANTNSLLSIFASRCMIKIRLVLLNDMSHMRPSVIDTLYSVYWYTNNSQRYVEGQERFPTFHFRTCNRDIFSRY